VFFGYRTFKTAVGAGLAIFIAQWLELEFFTAAGIITVLCIRATKKGSLEKAWKLLLASVTGLLFAMVIFELFGYHPLSLTVLLLLFIPTLLKIKAIDGIVTSIVILLHIYTIGTVTWELFLNELSLILIGITVGLVMNLYMPSIDHQIYDDQIELEYQFQRILQEYSRYLRDHLDDWDGKEITKASALIEEGKAKAMRTIDNHFLRHDDYFYNYFAMREKQFIILERILPFISGVTPTGESKKLASFLDRLSAAVNPGNTAQQFMNELDDLNAQFRSHELPKTHDEFVTRAGLFYIIHELEQYLEIKQNFLPDDQRTKMIKSKKKAYRRK